MTHKNAALEGGVFMGASEEYESANVLFKSERQA
jgi:hypothetical protein